MTFKFLMQIILGIACIKLFDVIYGLTDLHLFYTIYIHTTTVCTIIFLWSKYGRTTKD